ncbi:recombinase family protein [Pseudomonas nicosulfuronedens]|uniref:recombinase family protein n=1 Tax=Pseudomonas nicosulfuronedens TaxID=2571105 RepID=UPI00244C6E15|nr:recombinase family protein [Pseudomonas nicosulfuronedens]MDH1012229.1 recombinase family protein [Pseudomonas nicosulfuronedens]MDH1982736.1 recombinase family protein [Pseudomonas nicosulfuronedens]MDH2030017.1 recombinase family protein [Pseudomonas nicosulfuronedens]
MPTAYAYIRYSSKAQGEAGRDSVDRQMASIQAITKQQGIELRPENIFSDTGISAHDGSNKRKGKLKDLIDMINDVHIKPGDYIFVESIDRLSRQRLLQAKELVNSILEKGVILITTIDGQRYEKPNEINRIDDLQQDILLSVIAKRAHEESKTKSVRRKSAWNRAKKLAEDEKAIFNGHNPPYGISYNKEESRFEIVEDEAKEINDIFESLKYVGVSLTVKKVNAYSKRKWTNRNIKHLLDTKYVLGSYMAQRRDENKKKIFERYIENYYPQIVSYELFNEAVGAMKQRAHRKNYGNQTVGSLNIFRHSIKCDCCKASMLFEKQTNPKGVVYPYFQCFTRKELKNGCNQPRFRFDLAFGLFLELVYQSTTKEDFDPHPWQLMEIEEERRERKEITANGITYSHATNEHLEEEEKLENFKDLLISLLSSKKRIAADNKKVIGLSNSLLEQKSYKENLVKSFSGFTNGVIPKEFLEVVSKTEIKINEIEAELSKLQAEINTRKTSINIYSENDIIDLYKTEEGRLKINQFFISNDIVFGFNFETESRTLYGKIYYQGMMIDKIAKQFSLHNPLKEFGINNLNEYFN